eukprot:scaffold88_cov140-Isochrysis_galbana.AAC.4
MSGRVLVAQSREPRSSRIDREPRASCSASSSSSDAGVMPWKVSMPAAWTGMLKSLVVQPCCDAVWEYDRAVGRCRPHNGCRSLQATSCPRKGYGKAPT